MVRSGNPAGRSGAPMVPTGGAKFYVCCIKEAEPFMVKVDKDGLKEFNKHKEEVHGKAAAK